MLLSCFTIVSTTDSVSACNFVDASFRMIVSVAERHAFKLSVEPEDFLVVYI
jgi:hypothetical protein